MITPQLETTIRCTLTLRRGDWVLFNPSEADCRGINGWFYKRYNLKTAEILSFEKQGVYVHFREDGYEPEGALPVRCFSLSEHLLWRNKQRRSRKKPR